MLLPADKRWPARQGGHEQVHPAAEAPGLPGAFGSPEAEADGRRATTGTRACFGRHYMMITRTTTNRTLEFMGISALAARL